MSFAKLVFKKAYLKYLRRNEFESQRLRDYFLQEYGVNVGMYSYGCFDPSRFPRGTYIGRYCSFARTAAVFNGNHGLSYLTTHPYLYNVRLGVVEKERIIRTSCVIEDDVWLGHNSVVLPSVKSIGRGAVVAAGAVVTKDVPRYAIVAGNPAKVVKMRFDEVVIERIEASEWWSWSKCEFVERLQRNSELFYMPEYFFKRQ